MKVVAPLAKNILVQLGITAAASAIDAEMNDIMKIVQALEDSNILERTKRRSFRNVLGTLGASSLGNMLAGKGIV